MSKLFLLLSVFLMSAGVKAVCLSELDGQIYGCERLSSGDSWCKKKFGSESLAYRTTNTCSEELSYSLRGETYKASAKDALETVEASCMTYEDGEKLGCQYYDFFKAENFCAENYGHRYVPFVISKTCSLAKASALRGEVSSSKLLDGNLRSSMDEIDSLITMVDKDSASGLFTADRPVLKGEFYTNTMKAIMGKMNMIKNVLEKNSKLNIVMKRDKYVEEFLKESFRYLSFMARLHKLYAYVAHQNHYVLKTYTYENLAYLNLTLKKAWGLELLSKANFEVKTVDNGEGIEFSIGEQEKQTYEYMAMQAPQNVTDYAKAITFLGVRENVTNLWAVQRLTKNPIHNSAVRSCGKDFLSFRPDSKGSMEGSLAMKDLWSYDVFYNDYVSRWNELVDASNQVAILDGSSTNFMYSILTGVRGVKSFLLSQESISSSSDIKSIASQDSAILVSAENEAWMQFSNDHFSTIVLPGDDILSKDKVMQRIAEESFNHRVDAIVNAFVGIYVWLEDATIKEMEKTIRVKIQDYKAGFVSRAKAELSKALEGYGSKTRLAVSNREKKLQDTYEVAKKAAHAAYLLKKLDVKKPSLKGLPVMDPNGPEELMMLFQNKISSGYMDLKDALENNQEYAKLAHDFFQEISETFFAKVVDKTTMQFKYSEAKKRSILRQVTYDVARKYKKKYPMKLSGLLKQEDYYMMTKVAVDNTYVAKPKVLPVLKDGKAAVVSTPKLFDTFKKEDISSLYKDQYRVAVDNTRVVMGINPKFLKIEEPQMARTNPDKVTTGEIGKPVVVTDKGEIKSNKKIEGQYNSELLKLYSSSNVLSSKAKKTLETKSSTNFKFDYSWMDESKKIKSKEELISRIFNVLNLGFITVSDTYFEPHFISDVQTQMLLVQNYVGQAYQTAPILRNDFTWKHKVKKLTYNYKFDNYYETEVTENFTEPLLIKIALDTFNPSTLEVNKSETLSLISASINTSEVNVANKLSKFCNANYFNYKNDENFKDIYRASGFLRATMKDPTGVNPAVHNKIMKFDEQITKDIRSRWEALNEDYLEPTLSILGAVALISVAIVAMIGSGGAAAPGIIGLAYAGLSFFLSVEFFASFPLVVGSLYTRLNTHFIEVPAQLKFQRSLALSQVDTAKIVDWDMLKSHESENRTAQLWTIGLMPLDFFYGYSLVKHVRVASGIVAVNAYRRQTGMALRKFSAPPKSMLIKRSFSELREKHGLWKALVGKSKDVINNARMYQPRYTALPQQMIEGVPLRMGISRQAAKMGLDKKPWDILQEMIEYRSKLKARVTVFETYSKEQGKLIQELRASGNFKAKEALHFGLEYSKAGYLPKSLREAVKNGKVINYFKNFSGVLENLNRLQGELVGQRVENIGNLIDKMMDFKRAKTLGTQSTANAMDEFLGLLNTQEIMAMEEMAKWSKGTLGSFKPVFKDYRKIITGLRPISYLYGHIGSEFTHNPMYPANGIMGEDVDPGYAFKSDQEDIVEFYESMMTQNGFNGPKFDEMRREIEIELSRNFNAGRQ